MVSIIHHPTDKLFKLSMEEPRVAQEFLSAHLPPDLLKMINLTALQLENHSFIDEAYKSTEADIIFRFPMEEGTAYIYTLLEHQSKIDPLIAFRLLIYRVRLMERHQKKYPDQPLPLIYPLVVYNGEQPWETPIDLFALFGEHSDLAREWFLNPTRLLDIQKLPDEDINRRRWSGLIEFSLKYRKVIDFNQYLDQLLPWIHSIERIDAAGFSLSKVVIKYVLNGADAEGTELFIQKMQDYLSPELRGTAMTLAQQFKQQGEVSVISQMLRHRFKQVPETYLKQIEQADDQTLLRLVGKIMDAKTLEDVFEKL